MIGKEKIKESKRKQEEERRQTNWMIKAKEKGEGGEEKGERQRRWNTHNENVMKGVRENSKNKEDGETG